MVEDKDEKLITWSPSGDQFVIHNLNEFPRTVLPQYFKHSNYPSFVRQLNMYGFHKVANARQIDKQMIAFQHPDFLRGDTNRLQRIKRNLRRHRTTALGPYERLISPSRLQENNSKERDAAPLIAHMESALDDLEMKITGVHADLKSFRSIIYDQQQTLNRMIDIFSSSSNRMRLPQSPYIQSRLTHIQQHQQPQHRQHQQQPLPELPPPPAQGGMYQPRWYNDNNSAHTDRQ
ncbi:HSF-type DNA-binding-domain-containing protein [Syncephalastrum racemosum]|uniref:HSF-type DNA-binding-domain-containing protein n=1 Tax=Syncephalastrum racemosum TaxID=13706 RepID=A0A1X2HLR1_SYNRA|nr:HSF-type DNA-binding-domain-containing protein [Syncephalastrum racemosum]